MTKKDTRVWEGKGSLEGLENRLRRKRGKGGSWRTDDWYWIVEGLGLHAKAFILRLWKKLENSGQETDKT